MLIDRSRSEITAARITHLRLTEASEHSAEKISGRAHLADVFVRGAFSYYISGIYHHGVGIDKAYLCAYAPQGIQGKRDIADIGNVADSADISRCDSTENNGQGRVFHSAYIDLTV